MLRAYSEYEEQDPSQRLNSTERKKAIKTQTFTRVHYTVTSELQEHKLHQRMRGKRGVTLQRVLETASEERDWSAKPKEIK